MEELSSWEVRKKHTEGNGDEKQWLKSLDDCQIKKHTHDRIHDQGLDKKDRVINESGDTR